VGSLSAGWCDNLDLRYNPLPGFLFWFARADLLGMGGEDPTEAREEREEKNMRREILYCVVSDSRPLLIADSTNGAT
jgi:hypothetical protein